MVLCSRVHGSKDKGKMTSPFFLLSYLSGSWSSKGSLCSQGLEFVEGLCLPHGKKWQTRQGEAAGLRQPVPPFLGWVLLVSCGWLGAEWGHPVFPLHGTTTEDRHLWIHPKAVQDARKEQKRRGKKPAGESLPWAKTKLESEFSSSVSIFSRTQGPGLERQ